MKSTSSFTPFFLKFLVLLALAVTITVPARAQTADTPHGSAELKDARDHFRGGDEVVFKMVLNEPLPDGAYFNVRFSPAATDQELPVGSGEPVNKERTEFLLKAKLPEKVVPGEWHIKIVWLFLPGTSWTNNALATNPDFKFYVDGPKIDIPTKATASLVRDHQ
jgi:hypothetical protein